MMPGQQCCDHAAIFATAKELDLPAGRAFVALYLAARSVSSATRCRNRTGERFDSHVTATAFQPNTASIFVAASRWRSGMTWE